MKFFPQFTLDLLWHFVEFYIILVFSIGGYEGYKCPGDQSSNYDCLINVGTLEWRRDMGGEFACSAWQDERFLVMWYEPGNEFIFVLFSRVPVRVT